MITLRTTGSFLAGIFILWSFSCETNRVGFTAHRGASWDAPENTLAAFNLAWQQGADAIEGDFYLSKDGRIVCIHDQSTKRTSGVDMDVAQSAWEELRLLDVGAWKGDQWRGEKIPGLEEVMATVPPNRKLFIEIKCGPEITPVLKTTLDNSTLRSEQIVIISFQQEVIASVKKVLPEIKAFWLTSFRQSETTGGWEPSIEEILKILDETGADGLDCKAHPSIDAAFVSALTRAGMEFHIWTVDDPQIARRFIDLGVMSITTNRPAWLKEQLD